MKYTYSSFFGNFTVTVTIILPFRLFIIFIGVTISYFTLKKNMSSIHNQKIVSKNFSVIKIIYVKQNKFNDLTTLRWPKPWHGSSQYDDQWVDLLIKVCSQRANHRGRVESRDRSDIFVKKVILSSVRGVWAIVIRRLTTPWKDTSSWGTWSWISRSWRWGEYDAETTWNQSPFGSSLVKFRTLETMMSGMTIHKIRWGVIFNLLFRWDLSASCLKERAYSHNTPCIVSSIMSCYIRVTYHL